MEDVAIYASFKESNKTNKDLILNQIKKWCNYNNYNYTLYVDNIKNRNDLDRVQLDVLKDDIEKGKYSKVIVKNMEQISRDLIYNFKFLEFLDDNSCKIEDINGTDLSCKSAVLENIFEKIKKKKEGMER